MKQYMEVGERGYYDKKRYRCVLKKERMSCTRDCDLFEYLGTGKALCKKILCAASERPDKVSVVFKLQPKYRKEEGEMNYWIITVKEPYCDCILRGLKTMELRKSVPSFLRPGDVIFIVRKGDHGSIVGACRVTSVNVGSVLYFYNKFYPVHRVRLVEMRDYAGERSVLYGIGLERMILDTWCLNVRSFGFKRAPQWFYRIRPEFKSTIKRVLDVYTTGRR